MKRFIFSFILFGILLPLFPQSQWHSISKKDAADFFPTLVSSSNDETVIEFTLDGFYITDVNAPVPNSKIISVPRTASISEVGAPELRQLTAALIIPDLANMEIEILETEFFDIQDIEIAPSKGDFSRQIDPESIPYTYGAAYQQDAWYPGKLAELADPHIARDFRGTVAITYPFQYNPATKTLRVYHKIVVKVKPSSSGKAPVNPLYRNKALTSIVEDFHFIYENRYINYTPDKYNAPIERGRILVICHDAFIPHMTPYVQWKNQIGFPTEIVGVSTIGNTTTAIKNYVTNYYNTNGLAFILIVGDHTEVVTYNYGSGAYSDHWYGDILGNDSYPEVMVGRFSATTAAHVQTQVQRTLEYERATNMTTGWQTTGIGIARNEGSGMGHDGGEADYVHMNNIRTRLLAYNYTTVHQEYDGSVPGITNTTAAQISNRINSGASIINFCNHGSETAWSVANYSVTQVNALTNVKKLPFIWSVACVNGQFTRTLGDCFAEAWLKATNASGEPTGALAVLMSTINQPWVPPMDGQDEFNRVLCEHFPTKIRRTFGAISLSGIMHLLDLGPTNTDRRNTARTWLIFGDPSVMVRTTDPMSMTVSHDPSVLDGTTNLAVNCNTNDAFVTLTINYNIIGTASVSGGVANVNFPGVSVGDTILVTVTAYNKIPYEGIVVVENPSVPYDMQTLSIVQPVSSYACSGVSLTPKAIIRNMGINTITSCQVYYQLNSNPEQIYNWTGSLATLERDTVNLPPFVLTTGNHTYRVRVASPNGNIDMNTGNDEKIQSFTVQNLPVSADFAVNISDFCETPAVVQFTNNSQNTQSYLWDFGDGSTSTDENPSHEYLTLGSYTVSLIGDAGVCGSDTRTYQDMILVGAEMPFASDVEDCGGPASFTINATSTGPISWYSDAAGNNLIHTGSSYTTPMLNSSTTYYLGTSIENSFFGGKTNNSTTGGYFTSANAHGLILSCTSPVVLKSVKMYSGATTTQNRTIRLETSANALIQSVTVSVPPGESRVTLNLNIPVGTNMKLMGPVSPNLWRDGSTTIAYPFDIGGVIQIIQSTAQGAEQNYYYFFFDWEVEQVCASGLNPVTAYITSQPMAAFTPAVNANVVQFTSNSTGGNLTYIWNFGDGNTSTVANPQHVYQSAGTYTVSLTVSNSCGSHDMTQQVNITTTGIEESAFDFEIYPNPAEQFCMVSSPEIIEELLVVDIHGKQLQSLTPQSRNVKVDVSSFAQGMYFIRITTSEGTYIRPLQVK